MNEKGVSSTPVSVAILYFHQTLVFYFLHFDQILLKLKTIVLNTKNIFKV